MVCCRFSLLILSISFLISLSSFILSFTSCSFCFNMTSCLFNFDFIYTLSFTSIFLVCFSFCSFIFKSLICWLILSQFPNVLSTASNICFSWLIFVISFSFCCSALFVYHFNVALLIGQIAFLFLSSPSLFFHCFYL